MPLVVDASVALAWCFADEENDLASRALEVAATQGMLVPSIWLYEIANVLFLGVRRDRLGPGDLPQVIGLFERLQITAVDLALDDLVGEVASLALEHGLSVYDASYLFLALRERAPIATADRRLLAAAEAAGCVVFA